MAITIKKQTEFNIQREKNGKPVCNALWLEHCGVLPTILPKKFDLVIGDGANSEIIAKTFLMEHQRIKSATEIIMLIKNLPQEVNNILIQIENNPILNKEIS